MYDKSFMRQALSLSGSVTPRVAMRVAAFGAFAAAVCIAWRVSGWDMRLSITPYEVAGAVLGVLLVMRTNAGYDRWWEARKLWGGIVNQSRNLGLMVVEYGPNDDAWRERAVRLVALFPHAVRRTLRGERQLPEAEVLLGSADAADIHASNHFAYRTSRMLAAMLRSAVDDGRMDRFAYLQADRERALLVDHMGACERILKTPLPSVYAIKIRRFLVLFLATLPFALLDRAGNLTPLFVVLIAYSLLALDQIGVELEDPFSAGQLSRLPLDDICRTIESNVFELLDGPTALDRPPKQIIAGESEHAAAKLVVQPS